jgi:hypothetical protein
MLCGNVNLHYATATSTATVLIFIDVHTIIYTLIFEEEIHNNIKIMEQHDFDICTFMISEPPDFSIGDFDVLFLGHTERH